MNQNTVKPLYVKHRMEPKVSLKLTICINNTIILNLI